MSVTMLLFTATQGEFKSDESTAIPAKDVQKIVSVEGTTRQDGSPRRAKSKIVTLEGESFYAAEDVSTLVARCG